MKNVHLIIILRYDIIKVWKKPKNALGLLWLSIKA